MLPQYNVEELIENIKRRCAVPTSQLTYTDEDWTLLANDELQGEVVPLIMSTREEYFLDFVDVSVDSTREIEIPEYCAGEKLRSVCYVQASSPLVLVNLPRIDLDVVAGVGFTSITTLAGFYVQGNKLILYPNTSVPVGTTLRLYFYRRTLVLAAPDQYGQITAINTVTNTLTLDFVPYDWAATDELNAVSSTAPFSATSSDIEIVSVSSPDIVVTNVDDLSVGDYVSRLGYSAIPQVLIEAHPYLAQLTAAKALEGLGDRSGMEAALAKAKQLKTSLLVLISQRVDGSTKKIMPANGGLRQSAGLWRNGRGRF